MVMLALGALLMIWPGIFALFFGMLLLLQSCTAEQENIAWGWAEVRLDSYHLFSFSGRRGFVFSSVLGNVFAPLAHYLKK